jgi:hypothetical protein
LAKSGRNLKDPMKMDYTKMRVKIELRQTPLNQQLKVYPMKIGYHHQISTSYHAQY